MKVYTIGAITIQIIYSEDIHIIGILRYTNSRIHVKCLIQSNIVQGKTKQNFSI